MYELHAPVLIIAQRLYQSQLISKKDFQMYLKEVMQLLRDSHDILKLEPEGSNEYQMGLAAEEALQHMSA